MQLAEPQQIELFSLLVQLRFEGRIYTLISFELLGKPKLILTNR